MSYAELEAQRVAGIVDNAEERMILLASPAAGLTLFWRALAHAEVQRVAHEHEPQRRDTDLGHQLLRRSAAARWNSDRPAQSTLLAELRASGSANCLMGMQPAATSV